MIQQTNQAARRVVTPNLVALITFLLVVGLPMSLGAQVATGNLTGTVTDSTGAKVVDAAVTLQIPKPASRQKPLPPQPEHTTSKA